jgi:hypothetical protein
VTTRRTTKKSLTPAELFDYRLAALLGYADIDEMKRSMTLRSYVGWQRYWEEEPWGPWRDNLHTAIIAREVRRSRVKPNTKIDMDQFMVRTPRDRKKSAEERVFAGLSAVATPVSAEEGMRRMKAAKSRRKSGKARSTKK